MSFQELKKPRTRSLRLKCLGRDIQNKLGIYPLKPSPRTSDVQSAFFTHLVEITPPLPEESLHLAKTTWETLYKGTTKPQGGLLDRFSYIERGITSKWLDRGNPRNRLALQLTAFDLDEIKELKGLDAAISEAHEILTIIYNEWKPLNGKVSPYIACSPTESVIPKNKHTAFSKYESGQNCSYDKCNTDGSFIRLFLDIQISSNCKSELSILSPATVLPFLFHYLLVYTPEREDIEDAIVMDILTAAYSIQFIYNSNLEYKETIPSPFKEIICFLRNYLWNDDIGNIDYFESMFISQPMSAQSALKIDNLYQKVDADFKKYRRRYLSVFSTLTPSENERLSKWVNLIFEN